MIAHNVEEQIIQHIFDMPVSCLSHFYASYTCSEKSDNLCRSRGCLVKEVSAQRSFQSFQFFILINVCLTFLRLHGLQPARFLCPQDFPGKNTGASSRFLLQKNLPDPEIEHTSPVSQADSLPLSHQRSPTLVNKPQNFSQMSFQPFL